MAIDLSRVASKALEAAIEDERPRRRGSTVRAMAAGAALTVAARAAVSKAPGLVHLPSLDGLRDIPDRVRDRLAEAGWVDDEQGVDEAEPEAEYEDEEELEDEDEEEPVDDEEEEEEDEELEDEPEAEAEEEDEEPAPELEIESEDDEDLHPEDRPPKPPRSKARAS